jgi:crotonobetainyl-CoA:carnitine CoA-transferase CaiB-like acyl-CoA transferase
MTAMFEGIRVVEVAQWTFVPAGAGVLGDFGAEVIKIEDPATGDAQRGLAAAGVTPMKGSVNLVMEQTNRGKRSVALDLRHPDGRQLLYRLVATADVFVTNFLPDARRKLGIEPEELHWVKPDLIYVRGHAYGSDGADADKGGYDATAYWARGGIGHALTSPTAEAPAVQRPAFGDKAGAMNIAFGVAAALFRRERTGLGATVDVSLLGTALWQASSDIVYSLGLGTDFSRVPRTISNPLTGGYRTKDGRWLTLMMLESDRWWPDLCEHLGRPELLDDARYVDAATRSAHAEELSAELRELFASATLEEWRTRFATLAGPWSIYQDLLEAAQDPQSIANGYVTSIEHPSGVGVDLVAAPVQFDGGRPTLSAAPEHGADTEAVLLDLGEDWDDLTRYKEAGVII